MTEKQDSPLRFLGRGSAFTDNHNCAYFYDGDVLVLIDCPMSAFHRLRRTEHIPARIEILVTHTHSDHVSGIPLLIHYARFVWQIPIVVIAPTAGVAEDLCILIERLDGCDPLAYSLLTAQKAGRSWLSGVIPTQHVPALAGRCFGYRLNIGGENVIYTGDTAELKPFLPYLRSGTYLYTEASAYDSGVHLYIDKLVPALKTLRDAGVHVYLMHMDDEDAILAKAAETGAEAAPVIF